MKTYTAEQVPIEVAMLARELLPLLLTGEHPVVMALRAQWVSASIASAIYTGAGVYVNFDIPELPLVGLPNFCGGNAVIQADGVRDGAGCVLYVEDGKLSYLECYSYGVDWPEHPQNITITQPQGLEACSHSPVFNAKS